MKSKNSYEYNLILATAVVLFIISMICVYGMFYFKIAQINQMSVAMKIQYMNRMNSVLAPFVITLILLLGICVPKRLMPVFSLNILTVFLLVAAVITGMILGIKSALLLILSASLILQTVVLSMAAAGNKNLHFEKKGYWVHLGSSLIHLGLILFIFDLFFHDQTTLHLFFFWITTITIVLGMTFCFYSQGVLNIVKKIRN